MTRTYRILFMCFFFFLFGSHFSFQRGRGAGSSRKTTERPEVRTHALYKSTSLLKYPIVINNNNNNWGEQRVMFFFLLLIIFHDKNKIKRKWN